jgi:glycosyltransferase involved in cell wall biosynthesis
VVTGRRIRELERAGWRFDAAYFFQQTICTFLWRFRSQVPYVIAMDGTPLWYARNELWYAQPRFDPRSLVSRAKRQMTRRVYSQAFHLLPLSTGVRDSLVEDYGIAPDRITVMPPGIDLRRYASPDRTVRAPGPLRVLFVGAGYRRKGGDLLEALAARREFRDVEFRFVTHAYGGKPAPNIRVREDLAANSPGMLDAFRQADLFALPTRADSHSIASLEAMAMGLPVIATAVGGIVDVVEEGRTGYLVPRDDLEALADRIHRLRDPGLRAEMGRRARQRVEARFDNAAIADSIVEVLRHAAETRS